MTNPGQGFAKRVRRATLDTFKPLLRVSDEPSTEEEPDDEANHGVEAPQQPGGAVEANEPASPLDAAEAQFNGARFNFVRPFPRAPRVAPAAPPRAPAAPAPAPTQAPPPPPAAPVAPPHLSPPAAGAQAPAAPAHGAPPQIRGFWKSLSKWDANLGSAPGQIQIPAKFEAYFPPLTQTKPADAGGKGRRWETSFPIRFRSSTGQVMSAPAARYIKYEPGTGAARPNIEARFTFHNRAIAEMLQQGDVLVFRVLNQPNAHFEIELLKPGTPAHSALGVTPKHRYDSI